MKITMTDPLAILPYCVRDGIPTMRDSEMAGLFDAMAEAGTARTVFYDGTVNNRDEFVREMKRRDTHLFVVRERETLLAFFWLNTLEGRSARIHFCGFRPLFGRSSAVARECLKRTLHMRAGADFVLDTLIGVTPVENRLAVRMLKRAGMIPVGVIPGMLDNAYTRQPMDALVSYCTRKEFTA